MNAPAANDAWFYRIGDQQLGPLSADHLRHLIASGQIGQAVPVWCQGMFNWTPAGQVPQLRQLRSDDGMKFILPTRNTSSSALIAGYLGLFGIFFPPLGVVALVLGIMGVRDLKRHPHKNGWGRAVTGIVLGGLMTMILVFVLVSVFVR